MSLWKGLFGSVDVNFSGDINEGGCRLTAGQV